MKYGGSLMNFSDILKAIRKELNVTQEQLARDLNVSFTTLNRWENSRTLPSRLARIRLIEYCSKRNVSDAIIVRLTNL